jgi:hypothetical protein
LREKSTFFTIPSSTVDFDLRIFSTRTFSGEHLGIAAQHQASLGFRAG